MGSGGDVWEQRFMSPLNQADPEECVNGPASVSLPEGCLLWGGAPVERDWANQQRADTGGRVSTLESILGARGWCRWRYPWKWAGVSKEG